MSVVCESSARACADPDFIATPFFETLDDDATVFNFAFGANCAAAKVALRKLAPIESVPCRLRGFRLVFDAVGIPLVEPAFGNVAPSGDARDTVHGVAHLLDRAAWRRLQLSEGGQGYSRRGYVPHRVVCERYDGGTLEAYVLMYEAAARAELHAAAAFFSPPSRRYLDLVRGGGHYGVDKGWLTALERVPVTTPTLGNKLLTAVACLPLVPLFVCFWPFRKWLMRRHASVVSWLAGGMKRYFAWTLGWFVPAHQRFPEPVSVAVKD